MLDLKSYKLKSGALSVTWSPGLILRRKIFPMQIADIGQTVYVRAMDCGLGVNR